MTGRTPETIFIVTDIETTKNLRTVFDIAWRGIDRKGKVYNSGSFLVKDAFELDVPYFKEKLGYYFEDTYNHLITPAKFADIRDVYNSQISDLIAKGHKVVFVAYNAAFDAGELGNTSTYFLGKSFLGVKIQLMDLWHYWTLSAPKAFNYATPKGNPKTSAEIVYRYEFNLSDFVERHIALYDVDIESQILLKVLRRRKKMPLVNHPKEFFGQPWRLLKNYKAYKEGKTIIVDDRGNVIIPPITQDELEMYPLGITYAYS